MRGLVSNEPPSGFPPDRGVRHEIDLSPGTKYCVTKPWPLLREQCDVIDAFFRAKHEAGLMRESKSPHSTPTFCVRIPNDKWRIVHAFNNLNAAIIPAQTPIPRKNVLQNNMMGSTLYSALDLVDGYYQLLMSASDIPLTAVSTPSGMPWEWLVMPQGLSNAPAAFNRLVMHLFRPNRACAEPLYTNVEKCIFGAEEIPFRGCFVGKRGLRADPAKVKAIVEWPVPRNQKDLRKWLGLANYLHKYSENYAEMARPLPNLLKKDAEWRWNAEHQHAFEAIKDSLLHAPILAWPVPDRPFSVVCDASDFAIGCALLQTDAEGRERVIAFESRQRKAAAKNYPAYGKGLLAMKYKPGKQNALADALSRRPDYELAHVTAVASSILDLIRASYASDNMCVALLKVLGCKEFEDSGKDLSVRLRARLHRYGFNGGLLYHSTRSDDPPRVVVPHDDDLTYRILYEAHDTPVGGHLGREKTDCSVSLHYWWPNLYKWVGTNVRTCETYQRVKPAPHATATLASLPVPSGCCQSISMDFVFGLPPDAAGNTGVVVFIDRLSKMAHLAAVPDTIDGEGTASLFLDRVFRQHGLPETVVFDRDPRFTSKFWTSIFAGLGTRLVMFTADHPQTDGQTERVNRVVEDVLRSICARTPNRWSVMLPRVEFALNNDVYASTGYM
ncbi:unnamed protein product [Phytophthora fragariaefolia]|uniref:Unnamed protein product n=1 Tax=Phytophthora fragariaefolia TaxID=1490495 RepID=A0A9W6XFY0_9STRA|nr:unnamed protein product [Phytophthora fragariaefolia]